jgi:hypothetical protein
MTRARSPELPGALLHSPSSPAQRQVQPGAQKANSYQFLAMGQNRRKTGKTCLLTPSARSGRMGLQWMRAKSNSPSPAQRQVQPGAQKANSYQFIGGREALAYHPKMGR